MTNPDDIVRVRARNGGRASVYEANGWAQFFKAGLLEGNGVVQNTVPDMNVLVGGSTAKPDVLIATNPSGYKIALDVVGQQPIAITAPATDSRITSIVAYTDDLSLTSSETNVTGSPATCGLIVVNGATSATPSAPDDTDIRTAITADGATGSQAAYCVIAEITVESTTTALTTSLIDIKDAKSEIVTASNIDFTTIAYSTTEQVIGKWIDDKPIYCKIITGTSPSGNASSFNIAHGISDLGAVLPMTNLCLDSGTNASFSGSDGAYSIRFEVGATNVKIMKTDVAWKNAAVRCVIYYTKS